jgi:hypothetical protein
LLRAMATLPGGYVVYQLLQRHFGFHCHPDFYRGKLESQRDLARMLLASGQALVGAKVMEVGTGWLPLTAVGFWVCGAEEVRTFDINRHLLYDIFGSALRWMTENETDLIALWDGIVPAGRVAWCLARIREFDGQPGELLREAHITCHAPADASSTGLPGASIDIHYSTDVLEHVPPDLIGAILRESRRLLRPEGRSIHIVDPRDHFALNDSRISTINFLQYSEPQWRRYAGHYLAYHNRLRDPSFERLFQDAGLELLAHTFEMDARALQVLNDGFTLAPEFRETARDQLCRCHLCFLGRPVPA